MQASINQDGAAPPPAGTGKAVLRFDLATDGETAERLFKALSLSKVSLREWAQGIFAAGLAFLGATKKKTGETRTARVLFARRLSAPERKDATAPAVAGPLPYDGGGGPNAPAAFVQDAARDADALAEVRAALRLDAEAVALLALVAAETGRGAADLVRSALGAGLRKILAPRASGGGRFDGSPEEWGRDACFSALNRSQSNVRNPLDCSPDYRRAVAAFWIEAPREAREGKTLGAPLAPLPERPATPAGAVLAVEEVVRLGGFKAKENLFAWRKNHAGVLVPIRSAENPRHFAGYTAESVAKMLKLRRGPSPSLSPSPLLPGFVEADGAKGGEA